MIKRWLVLMIVLAISLAAIYGLDQYYCMKENERYDQELDYFSERFQAALSDTIVDRLIAVEDLKAFMLATGEIPSRESFNRYSAHSLGSFPTITFMAYADELNKLRYFYPVSQEYDEFVGADLSSYKYYTASTLKAIREKITTVNPAPVQLRSHPDKIIAARTPLYSDDKYLGLVMVGFEHTAAMRELLNKVTGSSVSQNNRYYIEISASGKEIFWRHNQLASGSVVKNVSAQVADVEWIVQIGWSELPQPAIYVRWMIWGIGSCVVLLLMAFLNVTLRRQEWLYRAVAEKTMALEEQNASLEEEIMERVRAEAESSRNELRLQAVLAAVPDILALFNKEGILLDFRIRGNHPFRQHSVDYRLYAFSREEIIWKSLYEITNEDLANQYMHCIAKTLATKQTQTIEYQRSIRDVIRDREARFTYCSPDEVLVIIRDTTEKKKDEACNILLREISGKVLQEEPLDDVLSYACDKLVQILACQAAHVSWKLEDGSMQMGPHSRTFARCVPLFKARWDTEGAGLSGEAVRSGQVQIQAFGEKGEMLLWQREIVAAIGEIRFAVAFPLIAKGEFFGALSLLSAQADFCSERNIFLLENLAQQMAIAISAAQDRDRLSLLNIGLEAAANAILISDANTNVEWANPAFTALTGYQAAEIIGKNIDILRAGQKEDEQVEREILNTIYAGKVWHGQRNSRRKNGEIYMEELTITPVRNTQGEITNFISIREDITEQIKAEKAMLEAKEARARAEKLSSIATMAAGISHEINQPLNSIKVIASGIAFSYNKDRKRDISEYIANIEEISRQADRINNIISHLRSFMRKDESRVEPCSLNIAVEQALQVVGKQLASHGLTVKCDFADNLPAVLAVPTALEEIVINLVVNAMQALDGVNNKEKRIVIRTAFESSVLLEVTDNGPGISPEIGQKVFEPFFSTKAGSDNLGLGLSIVNAIVTSYKGTANIKSDGKTGTTFRICFPAVEG